uniref:Putative secreted protein n=1 Tax=Anopheles triannulatus TaxID=58253 RepID=A0A2M4B777_9DIPT
MGIWLVAATVRWELLIRACYPVVHPPESHAMPCTFGVDRCSHHHTLFPVGYDQVLCTNGKGAKCNKNCSPLAAEQNV